MLQIRLSKGSSGDAGGGGGPAGAVRPVAAAETVRVACPDHLVLADLPVAKSIGAVTSSASAGVRSVGRRSRRPLGERVHFCVRCDFPIAIYGRLIPCEHVFCLACARSDASCYLCDERIQKIQTIKLMEGIFICAAPHCLKSFLKRSEFESHIQETHADLLQPNAVEKEGGSGIDARASSTDLHKQSLLQETSTARAPPRSGFSPSSNSQLQDREETRTRRHQSRDQPPPKLPLQPKQPSFQSRHQLQPGELQAENNPPQGFDRLQNWTHQQQNFENPRGPYQRRDSDQMPLDKPAGIPQESSFANYPPFQVSQPPNYPLPSNASQASIAPTSFGYATFPVEGSQPYYSVPYEMPRPELVPASAPEHASVLGFPPTIGIANFAGTFPRPWGVGLVGMPFEPSLVVGHGVPESYVNPTDSQGRLPSFQGNYGQVSEGLPPNAPQLGKGSELQGSSSDHNDIKGVLAPLPQPMSLPLPPPPPPLFPPISQQLNTGNYAALSNVNQENQGYGWQNDKHGFGNA